MSFEQKRYFESGVKSEQERIIKLLEDDYEGQDGIIWEQGHLDELVNLIKGEQK